MKLIKLLGNNKGSSIIFVLTILVIISLLFSVMIKGISVQHKGIIKSLNKSQARYNLESAVNIFLDSLRYNDKFIDDDVMIALPWGDTCRVESKPFGALLRTYCSYESNGKKYRSRSFVSEKLALDRRAALINYDDRSHFTVTGDAYISGPIKVGEIGLQIKPFKGKAFTGLVTGPITSDSLLSPPVFDNTFMELSVRKYTDYFVIPPDNFIYFDHLKYSINNHQSKIYYSDNDIILDSSYSEIMKSDLLIVSKGDIIIKDDIGFAEGSIFVSKGDICISDSVTGEFGIFYAENIFIEENVKCNGQFFATDSIIVTDQVVLKYPSMLFLVGSNSPGLRKGSIVIEDNAMITGSIIYPNKSNNQISDNGIIVIGTNARINGMIFSSNRIDFNGYLNGILMTYQCYFYDSPTHYVNWIRNGKITYPENDPTYCVPLGLDKEPYYQIIHYEDEIGVLD